MKSFFKEFKEFISRGNVIDLAVGVIIGGAFQKIVTSLVEDIITPLINMVANVESVEKLSVKIGSATLNYGHFIEAIISFLIMAFVIFMIIKGMNHLSQTAQKIKPGEKVEEGEEPTTKECPYCLSEIPYLAVRCPKCTSILKEGEHEN